MSEVLDRPEGEDEDQAPLPDDPNDLVPDEEEAESVVPNHDLKEDEDGA